MTSLIRGTLFEIMMASLMILGNHECTQPNSLVVKWHHKDTKDAKNGAALQPNLEMLGLFPFNLVGVKSSIISLHGGGAIEPSITAKTDILLDTTRTLDS